MATAVATTPATVARRRFTAEEFLRLAEVGILHENDRVELIDGEIIEMAAIGPDHAGAVTKLTRVVARQLPDAFLASVQNPIHLAGTYLPQPDLAVVRDRAYQRQHPAPADVLLVVEVADSSRDYDRSTKLPLYAAAGIPEAWLVDLVLYRLERHTEPRNGTYHRIAIAERGETLPSTSVPELTLPVSAILP